MEILERGLNSCRGPPLCENQYYSPDSALSLLHFSLFLHVVHILPHPQATQKIRLSFALIFLVRGFYTIYIYICTISSFLSLYLNLKKVSLFIYFLILSLPLLCVCVCVLLKKRKGKDWGSSFALKEFCSPWERAFILRYAVCDSIKRMEQPRAAAEARV